MRQRIYRVAICSQYGVSLSEKVSIKTVYITIVSVSNGTAASCVSHCTISAGIMRSLLHFAMHHLILVASSRCSER